MTHYRRVSEESGVQDEDTSASPTSEDEDTCWGQNLMEADILDETAKDGDAPHPIERWFGLHQFIILAPAKSSSAIVSESQAKLLLSSAQIAITNSRW